MIPWVKRIVQVAFVLSVVSVSFIIFLIDSLYVKPMVQKPVIVTVEKNTSALAFVNHLKSQHLISSKRLLLTFIELNALSPHLKAGIYEIKPGESLVHFLNKVVSGQVVVKSFTIVEGTNLNQVRAGLNQSPFLKHDENDWKGIGEGHLNPEGLLLADTYYYNAGSDANQLLKLAHHHLMDYLSYCWRTRRLDLPYRSPYELLIAASILEKETSIPAEKKRIAGVIMNRLNKNMPLQMDPTVIYALGPNYREKLTHKDLSIDSSYNTYRYRGLPPTPIAMVGKEALDAAAHPERTNYLYFVAKGDGSHQFSATYEEQKKAISQMKDKGSL